MPPLTLDGFGAHLTVHPFEVPLTIRFRGVQVRRGVLLSGPSGWGEFSAFEEYDDAYARRWLESAVRAARDPWPRALRDRIPVNASIPAVPPDVAQRLVWEFGSDTAKVKVGEEGPGTTASEGGDVERLEAVREALGPDGHIRIDVNARWSLDEAARRIPVLDRAAGGLQYVEQPVASLDDMAALRRRVDVPLAVDESLRTAHDPTAVDLREAADIAVLKVQPLGGVRRAMEVAEACGLPVVVSSALESSVGLAAGIAFAAALPELPMACGLGTGHLLARDVVSDPLVPVDGHVEVRRPTVTPSTLAEAAPEPRALEALISRLDRLVVVDSPYR